MSSKKIKNSLSLAMLISLLAYLCFAIYYPVNEFGRPYSLAFKLFIASFLIFILTGLIIRKEFNTVFHCSFCISSIISLCLLTSNYIFSKESDFEFKIQKITQAKGESVNWHVETEDGVPIRLHISRNSVKETDNIYFQKGILGFYFGNKEERSLTK
jgi:hypothetical protein